MANLGRNDSLGLIALVVLNLFQTLPSPGANTSFDLLAIVAFAVFVLIAKRRERRPDFTAVFR